MSGFPTDEVTLTMLISACQINPDTGQTHLLDFLDMGAREKSETEVAENVYFVEYEEGYEPFSPHQVIETLAKEVLSLRAEK